jgi:hypothetical protein
MNRCDIIVSVFISRRENENAEQTVYSTVPAPRNIRDTFQLLANSDGSADVRQLFVGLSWRSDFVYQIYEALLNRSPGSSAIIRAQSSLDPADLASNALQSAEFQNNIIEIILNAYPEKRRLFHIHVPKSAEPIYGTH